MKKIEKRVFVEAPVERVFEFVVDPNNLLSVWPSLIEVKNVKVEPSGAHSFDWTYKMVGLRFHGHADATEVEKNRRVVTKNEGGIPSTFEWLYASKDSGTEITLRVDYELPNKALDKLAEPIVGRLNEREAETLLHNIKAVMEHRKAEAAE